MSYVNYNKHGQNVGHNSLVPSKVKVDGEKVTYAGDMSKKTSDIANAKNLISHTITGQYGTAYCTSPEAAEELSKLLNENPNYQRA